MVLLASIGFAVAGAARDAVMAAVTGSIRTTVADATDWDAIREVAGCSLVWAYLTTRMVTGYGADPEQVGDPAH